MVARHPVRLVCVDLGGVVIRIRRTLEETLHAVGVPGYMLEAISGAERGAYRALAAAHQRGEHDCATFLDRAHDAFGGRIARETLLAAHDAILADEYPGVAHALGAIRAAGTMTACLSNTNDRHWDALVRLPAFAAIEHRHASHLLGLEKPGEAMYRAFERAVGTSGGEILFLDDLAENCAAARACGWHAVRIDHERDTARQIIAASRAHGVAV
ncbi:MAG: HAD-IA family hydrolase [Planctomycetaceae bacterium]|nr:HAD-IA family hydrolase [Planctomycetaceae bacterium]